MVTLVQTKLPGVYFLPPPPRASLGLPPLDVAAFVGFAPRGPLHQPVAVNDQEEYRAVFGGDMVLARTPRGEPFYAHLSRCVADFFANGGRRCYVVRIAGEQSTPTRVRVPGLVALDDLEGASHAALWTSSVGRWAESMRIGARLSITPLLTSDFTVVSPGAIQWQVGRNSEFLQPGDLLRLTFDGAPNRQWLVPVRALLPVVQTAGAVRIDAARAWAALSVVETSPAPQVATVALLTPSGEVTLPVSAAVSQGDDGIHLILQGEGAEKLAPGDLMRLDVAGGSSYLFPLVEQRQSHRSDSPFVQVAEFVAPSLITLPVQAIPTATLARVERLRFDLHLHLDAESPMRLGELGFNQPHPRFWGETLFLESSPLYTRSRAHSEQSRNHVAPESNTAQTARAFHILQAGRRHDDPRIPPLGTVALAGLLAPLTVAAAKHTFLPLAMPGILTASTLMAPLEGDVGDDDLQEMDGDRFARLFLDSYLVPLPLNQASGESARTLMAAALDRYYIQNQRLHGLHSLLFIDEVALLSLPDAIHRLWHDEAAEALPEIPPLPEAPPEPPCPAPAAFVACNAALVVETTTEPLQIAAAALDQTAVNRLPLRDTPDDYLLEPLIAVQRGLAIACQARADAVGILSLPNHFEKDHCVAWLDALRAALNLPRKGRGSAELGDLADLSYLAVYHPWLLEASTDAKAELRAVPPDGAVCGMIAARERARQLWIAPANEPLQDVLGLNPILSTFDWETLFALGFNLIRHEPRDFRAMSAHTLTDDHTLLQISVRRLMILLRKVALERGMDFVFENNHARFREGVRVMLEEMLRFMFERGAFAGATPEQSFRVVTDSSVNTPQSIDQGRFIAQIQVAPSQPMEFITVQLIRTGQGQFLASEV